MKPAAEWCAAHRESAPLGAWLFAIGTAICGAVLLYGAGCAAWSGLMEVLR